MILFFRQELLDHLRGVGTVYTVGPYPVPVPKYGTVTGTCLKQTQLWYMTAGCGEDGEGGVVVSYLGHVDGVNETKDVGRLRTGLIQNNKTTVPEQNRYR